MNRFPYRSRTLLGVLALLFLPAQASAHAVPQSYAPSPNETIPEHAGEISITYTERPEEKASSIRIYDATGKEIACPIVPNQNPHTLTCTHESLAPKNAPFTIAWNVLSRDDGHESSGAYLLGDTNATCDDTCMGARTNQYTEAPLAKGMVVLLSIELLAYTLMAAIVLRDVTEWRYLLVATTVGSAASLAQIAYLASTGTGSLVGLLGTLTETRTGQYALVRAMFSLLYIVPSRAFRALCLVVLAVARTAVSHAATTHNPTLTISLFATHLMGKEVLIAYGLGLIRDVSTLSDHIRPYLYRAALLVTGTTASYIVWLHLKDVSNITATNWGMLCAIISVFAGTMLLGRYLRENHLAQQAGYFASALLIVLTSAIILTTPPLDYPRHVTVFRDSERVLRASSHEPYRVVTNDQQGTDRAVVYNTEKALGPLPIIALSDPSTAERYYDLRQIADQRGWELLIEHSGAISTLAVPKDLEAPKRTGVSTLLAVGISVLTILIVYWGKRLE